MPHPAAEITEPLPLVSPPVRPAASSRPGRCEIVSLVVGSVLAGGAVVGSAIWWVTDPEIPRAVVMNVIFMALMSGAVVGLFFGMGRWFMRCAVDGVALTIEVQAQAFRSQLYDLQWQLAEQRGENRKLLRSTSGREELDRLRAAQEDLAANFAHAVVSANRVRARKVLPGPGFQIMQPREDDHS